MFEFLSRWWWVLLAILPGVGYFVGKKRAEPQAKTRAQIRKDVREANAKAGAERGAAEAAATAVTDAAAKTNAGSDQSVLDAWNKARGRK